MTDDELNAIEDRANAATDGPWEHKQVPWDVSQTINVWAVVKTLDYANVNILVSSRQAIPEQETIANSLFAAHARTDVPALVAEVRRLRAQLDLISKPHRGTE